MKKVLMLTSGHVPVPASKSGGVENLIDIFVEENEKFKDCQLDIISIYDDEAAKMTGGINDTKFTYIHTPMIVKKMNKLSYFVANRIFKKKNAMAYASLFTRMFYIYQAAKYIKLNRNEYEYVIVENHPSAFMALKKYNNYNYFENKILYHVHNEFHNDYGCKKIIEQSKIICVSQFIANSILNRFNVNPNQVKVLRNCVRKMSIDQEFNMIEKYGIPNNHVIFTFFGRIIPEKGILQLIQAFNKLEEDKITLLIVGSSAFEENISSDYEKKVRAECLKSKHQIISTGYVDYEKIANYYTQSDVIVVPSIWNDPAPLTVIESIIYDRPLIATISGGIPEYASNNSAILVERNDKVVDNLNAALHQILSDHSLVDELNRNRQLIRKDFTLEQYYKDYTSYIV
ncbi:glycosyltransferase family 4 protein [Apilactobacillus timberlakei]|uniref:glycosyltransferase family 4 protein n=1 Tax=Apilactobacillus timberlakei TaxID=2008380 RepID=UPI00112EA16D|nr:glycosyltransferase family 4 protein [Apilactobacillus timberlakei]TPR14818.1 glycosyltransferase [Apilactobacillus timberlakei]